MKTSHLLIIFLSLANFSCNHGGNDTSESNEKAPHWDKITLRMHCQSIVIYSDMDTMTSNTWELQDSMVDSGELRQIPVNEKRETIALEPSSIDSIGALVMDMITHPTFTDRSVSCYAGNIRICMKFNNTELCCNYSSVADWTTISDNARKLYEILNARTKVSRQ
jgi:hypothetical protein